MATLTLPVRALDPARAPSETPTAATAVSKRTPSISIETWRAMPFVDKRDLLHGMGMSRSLVQRLLSAEARVDAAEKVGAPVGSLPTLAAGTCATVTRGDITITIGSCGRACPRAAAAKPAE